MSEGIELIREDEVHHGNHSHSGGVEPHVWNSTQNAYIIAENIFHTLCKLDSANISYYKENLAKLESEIEAQTAKSGLTYRIQHVLFLSTILHFHILHAITG